jgi:TetR/AcrR family transcriptional repressor of nem operon
MSSQTQGIKKMRVSQDQMDANHKRVVEGASRLLRERGVRSTSVADAMQAAGLTHGGFYRHFDTKEALVAEALRAAFDEFLSPLMSKGGSDKYKEAVKEYRSQYLSEMHLENPQYGCPMPTLGADIGRESAALKREFGAGFQRISEALAAGMEGTSKQRLAMAMREMAMMVGAVMIARASDPETAQDVLAACKNEFR